jgi:uncharacterized protein YydD (DUF2326 family)
MPTTVASVWAKSGQGFPVLIHDSSLFADVDPRQYAATLKLAAENSAKYGFQHICCLNVGSLPRDHFADFDIEPKSGRGCDWCCHHRPRASCAASSCC